MSSFIQITHVLTSTLATSGGLQDITMMEFQNGSVIAFVSVQYTSGSSVSADDIDSVLTSYAESQSLTDGVDTITVESQTIIGKNLTREIL